MTASDYLAEHEPRRLALVLGNARYQHLAALPGALLDADLMQARLLALDFGVTRCSDIESVAQFEDEVLPAFRRQIRAGDLVVFYFSGHGFSHGPGQYLALADTDLRPDARQLADVAIPVEAVQDYLSRPLPGLLLLVLDACRGIAGFSIADERHPGLVLKGEAPARSVLSARVNLLIAYASRPGMPAIASDRDDHAARPSLFTTQLLTQLGNDDREFGTMFNEVSARVRQASDERQQPGLQDWSDTDLYLHLPPSLRDQQKEAWLVALSSASRLLVQRFAYRFSISRHAAAARAWLAEHLADDSVATAGPRRFSGHATAHSALDGLRSALLASEPPGQADTLLLELRVPPLPGGLPELAHGLLIEQALAGLHDSHRNIASVTLAIAPGKDANDAQCRESRLQHVLLLLERGGIGRYQVTASQAAVGDDVRVRFFGHGS